MKYIEVENVSFFYDKKASRKVLNNVNLSVEEGLIFGFLGPNGAGKTTLLKILLGIIPDYEGSVSLVGKSPQSKEVKTKIGFMPEVANYYWYLTPREILRMYGHLFFIEKNALELKIDELLSKVDLFTHQNVLMKNFSKGMLQKVSFAQALINDPDLLIFDEPTSGLDPIARINMRNIIQDFKAKGKTVFFSSHELSEIETICDEVAIIDQGTIRRQGPLKTLLSEKGKDLTLEKYFIEVINSNEG